MVVFPHLNTNMLDRHEPLFNLKPFCECFLVTSGWVEGEALSNLTNMSGRGPETRPKPARSLEWKGRRLTGCISKSHPISFVYSAPLVCSALWGIGRYSHQHLPNTWPWSQHMFWWPDITTLPPDPLSHILARLIKAKQRHSSIVTPSQFPHKINIMICSISQSQFHFTYEECFTASK